MSGERPVSRIQLAHSRSQAGLEGTVRDQLASVPAKMEDTAVRLFGSAERAAEWNPGIKVLVVIRTVVIGSIAKAFEGSAF